MRSIHDFLVYVFIIIISSIIINDIIKIANWNSIKIAN